MGPAALSQAQPSIDGLDQAQYVEERRRDDLNPMNFRLLDEALGSGRNRGARQQATLLAERKRLEQMQAEQMFKASQDQFMMRLFHRLNPKIGTLQDTEAQPANMDPRFMTKLMMQMRGGQLAP